jgi:hypothetical protein
MQRILFYLTISAALATSVLCAFSSFWCLPGAFLIGALSSFIYQTIDLYVGTKAKIKQKKYDLQDIFYEGLGNMLGARVSKWLGIRLANVTWFKGLLKEGLDLAASFLITGALKMVFIPQAPAIVPNVPRDTSLRQGSRR